MKNVGAVSFLVCCTCLCLLLSLPAWADSQLYTDGPINGNLAAYTMGNGQILSDSFGLGSASTIVSISIGDLLAPGDTPLTVTWSISSDKLGGGTVFASGTSSLTNTLFCSAGPGCGFGQADVYTSTFSTNVALGPGSYWLNFSDSTQGGTQNKKPLAWDVNRGVGCSGVGCPSTAYGAKGQIDPESFTLYGLNPIPEPSTVLDILGSGVFASLGLMFNSRVRQKLFRGMQ